MTLNKFGYTDQTNCTDGDTPPVTIMDLDNIFSNHVDYVGSYPHYNIEILYDSKASKPLSDKKISLMNCVFFESLKNHQPDSIEEIIEHINRLGYLGCSERIAFLNNTDDLEEGELPLCLESAKGFLLFFTQFDVLGEPVLGLFPEGTLSAGWRLAENKHLLVEPLDSQNASFALIGPSNDNPDEKFRLNGRGKIVEVIKTLKRQGIDQWRSS